MMVGFPLVNHKILLFRGQRYSFGLFNLSLFPPLVPPTGGLWGQLSAPTPPDDEQG